MSREKMSAEEVDSGDLLDRMDSAEYLGREFLTWLWFETEVLEGISDPKGMVGIELTFESQLALSLGKEQCRIKAEGPAQSQEAHEALRQGKLPEVARLRVVEGANDYGLVFTADRMGFGSVRLPSHEKDEKHEQFYERMYLIERLEAVFEALYGDFLTLRLSDGWHTKVVPFLQAWVRGDEVQRERYEKLRAALLSRKRESDGTRDADVSSPDRPAA